MRPPPSSPPDMTPSHVGNASFTRTLQRIPLPGWERANEPPPSSSIDMTHSCMGHDSFTCGTGLIHEAAIEDSIAKAGARRCAPPLI